MSLLLAVLAYSLLSTGFVLMKKGIAWIGFKGHKDNTYYTNLLTWILGFILMNLYIVPTTLALKQLDPHIVSSMAGWGVLVMVFLSYFLLKEKLFVSDFMFTAVTILAILGLNLLEPNETDEIMRFHFLLTLAIIPLCLTLPALLRRLSLRSRALFFATISGISTGMIIVMMKVLVQTSGLKVSAYFSSPYLYLYLLFSLAAFVSLQAAYKMGKMMLVGPVQYSAAILYPVLASILVFGNQIHPLQPGFFILLIFAVSGILRKH